MKIICLFFAMISVFTVLATEVFGSFSSATEDKDKTPMALDNEREEYKQIFVDFLLSEEKWFDFNGTTKHLSIDRYEEFVKKYPKSFLADEAKLRIAEFYSVIRQTWEAKRWLDDIIKNHPHSNMEELKVKYAFVNGEATYSNFELISSGEKTAAWALYYRAIWFPQNKKKDLLRIIKDYPESRKVVGFAKKELDFEK